MLPTVLRTLAATFIFVVTLQSCFGQPSNVGLYDPMTSIFDLDIRFTNRAKFIDPPLEAWKYPVAGDWDGDGRDSIGLYDRECSEWHLKNYENGYWDPSTSSVDDRSYYADYVFTFGEPDESAMPIVGDWNNSGRDSIGLFFPATSRFELRNSLTTGSADIVVTIGPPGYIPVAGDWNGDGFDTLGFFDPVSQRWEIYNELEDGEPDQVFWFGPQFSGWTPLAGDWNNDGIDTIGLYEPARSYWHLRDAFAGGNSDHYFNYGTWACNWEPITGDWDGDGHDSVGLYNQGRNTLEDAYDPIRSEFHLRNPFSSGPASYRCGFGWHNDFQALTGDWDGDGRDDLGVYDPSTSVFHLSSNFRSLQESFVFGTPRSGFLAIAGDWDGDGIDTVGLFNPVKSEFELKNSFSGGPPDIVVSFGTPQAEWWPVAGDWDGDGTDTVGLYFREASEFHLINSHDRESADIVFQFGTQLQGYPGPIMNWPGDFPMAGDWDDDGTETVGLYDPETSQFFLIDDHRPGSLASADHVFHFAPTFGGWPVAGRF